jgi:hypothetical protein
MAGCDCERSIAEFLSWDEIVGYAVEVEKRRLRGIWCRDNRA